MSNILKNNLGQDSANDSDFFGLFSAKDSEFPKPTPTEKPEITFKLIGKILEDMIEEGITPAIRRAGITVGDFFGYMNKRPELMNVYISNQQTRAEVMADDIIGISDDDNIPVDRVKVKVLSRQWFSSRILYRKYGDKLSVDHTHHVDIKGAIDDAKKRVARIVGDDASFTPIPDNAILIPETVMVSANPVMTGMGDEGGSLIGPVNAYPVPEGKEDVWLSKQFASIPEESRPRFEDISIDELEEVDIFS